MPSLHWLRRASRALAGRLDRLRLTFEHLREQLRDAISQQIGQTVAGAVRDAVHQLLAETPFRQETAPAWRSHHSSSSRDPMWDDDSDDAWAERRERWDDDAPVPTRHEVAPIVDEEAAHANLNRAVMVGCEAAAWWLRQRWGRLPLVTAVLIGALAAAVSHVGGPLSVAGVAMAGSAVSLMTLARRSQLVADWTPPVNQP
jgi:hypothetical protein